MVGYPEIMIKEKLINVVLESRLYRIDIMKLGEVKTFEGIFELELAE